LTPLGGEPLAIALRPTGALVIERALWGARSFGRALALGVALTLAGLTAAPAPVASGPVWTKADPAVLAAARSAGSSGVPVIVQEQPPRSSTAEALVRSLQGTVTRELRVIRGFVARIPGERLPELLASDSVARVWSDGKLHMEGVNMRKYDRVEPNDDWRDAVGLDGPGKSVGHGKGTVPNFKLYGPTVALLDTGVAQIPDLGNRVLARVDLTPDQDGLDRYGHGTHMAGIIAGDGSESAGEWVGANPKAYLVSVKVARADGSTDVSVVLAGLQWVLQHRALYGIRVLNLSFGTDSRQPYRIDPLDYAVEQVWRSGILVVVAAGNRGPGPGTINKPADDPFVLTVGAADTNGTPDPSDDAVAPFSSRGPTQDAFSKPDLVAPGVSIVSDRDDESTLDEEHPDARVGDAYFKGSGTSQATAVASGVASLLFKVNPRLTPDEAKAILVQTANPFLAGQPGAGAGELDASAAYASAKHPGERRTPANLGLVPSDGSGSLEASRGSLHVYADLPDDGLGSNDADGVLDLVTGEIDVLGQPWSATGWSSTAWSSTGWASLTSVSYGWGSTRWNGTGWNATGWSGTSWTATAWSATGWRTTGWSTTGWSATGWSANLWS
jgi:serine protease AprX